MKSHMGGGTSRLELNLQRCIDCQRSGRGLEVISARLCTDGILKGKSVGSTIAPARSSLNSTVLRWKSD
jgi:hypothetical protein